MMHSGTMGVFSNVSPKGCRMIVCPKCNYRRTSADSAPDWQCPSCGVAYNKVMPQAQAARSTAARATVRTARPTVREADESGSNAKLILGALLTVVVLAGVYWKIKHKAAPVASSSDQFEKAKMALDGNDMQTAFDGFSALAEKGDPKAEYYLGYMYRFIWQGHGVRHAADMKTGAMWLTKAAEQGDIQAQVELGKEYTGKGLTPDSAMSVKWFQAAADQGDAFAQTSIGFCYEKGNVYAQSYAQAANWYRKSAEQGEPGGLYQLAGLYATGNGVTRNGADAYALYKLAAQQNDINPGEGGGFWAKVAMEKLSPQLSASEIDEGNRLAANWSPGKVLPF
jgi:TPR repeat protein